LHFIGQLGRILSIGRELPTNVLVHIVSRMHILYANPKLYKLDEVFHRENFSQINFSYPSIIFQGFINLPTLFLFGISNMIGAISLGFLPPSHGASQKQAFHPFPVVIAVAR
jgi:hypothetical protein